MLSLLPDLLSELLDASFPRSCPGCEAPLPPGEARFCPACRALIPPTLWPIPLKIEGLSGAWALSPYESPAGAALRRGKYRPDERALQAAAEALAEAGDLPAGDDFLVPVPQTLRASWERGFCPTWTLASALSKRLQIPVLPALRRRGGRPLASLSPGERAEALRGKIVAARELSGRALLVDDVVTTGATAALCARELLSAGARRVRLVAVASVAL